MQNKSALRNQIENYRKEISELKSKIRGISAKKESEYARKNDLSAKIAALIEKISVLRTERRSFLQTINKSAEEKEAIYKQLNEKTSALKDITGPIAEITKKEEIPNSPEAIKKRIEDMEYKLQIEVISFEKEKEIYKQAKKLRAMLGKSNEISGLIKKKKELLKEISEIKGKIQPLKDAIRQSKEKATAIEKESEKIEKEIEALKKAREEVKKTILGIKDEFQKEEAILEQKFAAMEPLIESFRNIAGAERLTKKEYEERLTKEKQEQVKEKMRRREKLTTEDLIVFQGKL